MLPRTSEPERVNPAPQESLGSLERFVAAATKERWLAFLPLEHEVLRPLIELTRDGEEVLVRRDPAPGRPVSAGRGRRERAPLLVLQAAWLTAFLQTRGCWLDE